MSGNDYADFFPLDTNITGNDPTFPEVFQSNGLINSTTEFNDLTPALFIDSGGYTVATEYENITPATFKYELTTTSVTTTVTKYRMRGYFIGGSTYEFWITTDPNSANPSGNPLVGKVIDSIITAS